MGKPYHSTVKYALKILSPMPDNGPRDLILASRVTRTTRSEDRVKTANVLLSGTVASHKIIFRMCVFFKINDSRSQ